MRLVEELFRALLDLIGQAFQLNGPLYIITAARDDEKFHRHFND